jgi:hypothetical protein
MPRFANVFNEGYNDLNLCIILLTYQLRTFDAIHVEQKYSSKDGSHQSM